MAKAYAGDPSLSIAAAAVEFLAPVPEPRDVVELEVERLNIAQQGESQS